MQSIPYRNSAANHVNGGKIMSNSINSMSQASDRHSSLFSEKRSNANANNFSCEAEKTSSKEKKSERLSNTLLKKVAERPDFASSNSDSTTNAKLLGLEKNISDNNVPKITTISKNPSETQQKYAPRFFPKKSNSSLNGDVQPKLNLAVKPGEKYAPRFNPKQPKQKSTPMKEKSVSKVIPKVKGAAHTPKVSVSNALNIPLEPRALNHKGIISDNSHLNLTPDKFKKSAVGRKTETPRMKSKKRFGSEVEGSQGEVTKDKKKNVNSRKRMNDDDDFLSPKGNKTKKAKIDQQLKDLPQK